MIACFYVYCVIWSKKSVVWFSGMLYHWMILSNIAPARVWGGKGQGKTIPKSVLNLYSKQWVLSLILCLLDNSNLKVQVKKHQNYLMFVYFLFTLSFVYISRLLSRCSSFGSYKSYSKPLYSCFRSNISQHFEAIKVIIDLHCTEHIKVIFYFTQV